MDLFIILFDLIDYILLLVIEVVVVAVKVTLFSKSEKVINERDSLSE
jgi:hypothetical protein